MRKKHLRSHPLQRPQIHPFQPQVTQRRQGPRQTQRRPPHLSSTDETRLRSPGTQRRKHYRSTRLQADKGPREERHILPSSTQPHGQRNRKASEVQDKSRNAVQLAQSLLHVRRNKRRRPRTAPRLPGRRKRRRYPVKSPNRCRRHLPCNSRKRLRRRQVQKDRRRRKPKKRKACRLKTGSRIRLPPEQPLTRCTLPNPVGKRVARHLLSPRRTQIRHRPHLRRHLRINTTRQRRITRSRRSLRVRRKNDNDEQEIPRT